MRIMKSRNELVRIVWQASPPAAAALFGASFLAGLIPVAYMLVAARLIGALTGISATIAATELAWLCLAAALLFAVQQSLVPVTRALAQQLGGRLGLRLRETILRASLERIGLAHLEEPEPAQHVAHATHVGSRAFDAAEIVLVLSDKLIARTHGFAAAGVLVGFRWWAPLLLWASWSLLPAWIRHITATQMKAATAFTAPLRFAGYLRQLTLRAETAKELRLFNLGPWLLPRFTAQRSAGLGSVRAERRQLGLRLVPILALPAGASAFVLHHLVIATLARELTIADFTLFALSLIGAKHIGHTMAWWVRGTHHARAVTEAAALPSTLQRWPDLEAGFTRASGLPHRAITFENLSFSYTAATSPVFRDLNLTIPAGRSLAIVGENGSGKTTLIKLLARFYDPTHGRVLVDGVDLRELDPATWRRQLAVVFQDFIHYEGTARDNISPDGDLAPAALGRAIEHAGAAELISALPAGLETPLSRAYRGGTDLSGGQWQRIALARTFAAVQRGARVLILDEPTANLDVRAESELFDRFLEITRGLTTVLITHRLATVRHADAICVLEHGAVVELGSHEELMARGDRYAALFQLQAQRFAEVPA